MPKPDAPIILSDSIDPAAIALLEKGRTSVRLAVAMGFNPAAKRATLRRTLVLAMAAYSLDSPILRSRTTWRSPDFDESHAPRIQCRANAIRTLV